MTAKRLIVTCPHCQKKVGWNPDNHFRPFCCERCKLIDLGEWADEKKAIPGEPADLNFEESDGHYFE